MYMWMNGKNILLQVRVFTIEHVYMCMKLKEMFNSTYVCTCTYVSNFNFTLQYKLARVHGCAIGILPEVVGYFV